MMAALLPAVAGAAVPSPPQPLCIDAQCPESAEARKKWNPGHYMLPFRGDSQQTLVDRRAPEVCQEPALRGMQVRWDWYDLEPAKGNYSFDGLMQLYEALSKCQKRLVVEVWPVEFGTSSPTGIVPNYLLSSPEYNGGVVATKTGFIARLWERAVMDRLIALNTAMAVKFDSLPYFEGIIITETATAFSDIPEGYTPGAYASQLKRLIAASSANWPRTNVIMFNNYLQNSSDSVFVDLVQYLQDNRAGTGGPDTLPPPHSGTRGERIYRGEIDGVDRRGLMPAMYAVQSSVFNGKEGSFLPEELYVHCVNTNRCSHMFWLRNVSYGSAEQQWSTGILPFLRQNPRTREACPASYKGACSG